MRISILFIIIISFSINIAKANTYSPQANEYNCAYVDRKISQVASQMRSGYSAKMGERLRDKERSLKALKVKCKKARFPTSK